MFPLAIALVLAADADGLGKDEIQKVVKQHQSEIKLCYEQQLQKNPSLTGKVVLSFTIGRSGSVTRAEAGDGSTLDNGPVVTCMTARARKWKFPKPHGGGDVDINYPFVFTAANAEPEPPPDLMKEGLLGQLKNDDEAQKPEDLRDVEAEPDPAQRAAEDRAFHEHMMEEANRPRSLAESWEAGGAGMYPILIGLMMGLLSGLLGIALAAGKAWRVALVAGSLGLGGGAWAFSCGCLGYINGMMGARRAVSHVAPADRETILFVAESEASVCWKFGFIVLGVNGTAGLAAMGLALQRKRVANG